MKKSNLLIAVFAVLAAVSVAKAEDIKVDFDGAAGGWANEGPQPLYTFPSIFENDPLFPDPFPMPETELNCEPFEIAGEWYWPSGCSVPLSAEHFSGMTEFSPAGKTPVSRGTGGGIASFIVSYANTHSDFAASVLPIFASGETRFFFGRKGNAYAVNGKRVVRLDFARLGELAAAGKGQEKIAPALEAIAWAVQAGQAVYNAYQAWDEYHSSNNDDSGSGETGGSGSTYHQGQGEESQYDVNKRLN